MKLVVGLGLCGLASIAAAQPAPPGAYQPQPGYEDPVAHRHDGFFLRMWIGPAYTSMKQESSLDVSGSGGSFGIAAGFAVQENLIVFGQLFDDIAVKPTVKLEGESLGDGDFNAGVVGVGAGLSYYFMPSNIYVSGVLTATKITVQRDGEEIADTGFGPGLSLMAGKEWWVTNNWGLGAAVQLFFGSGMKDDDGPDWASAAAALAFSATYN